MELKKNLNSYLGMTKRNILMFFKDKSTLFFSMLAPLIVLGLYLIFLKETYTSSIMSSLSGLEGIINAKDVDSLSNAWLLAGLLGTSCITVALNSLSVMVGDKEKKVDYDYNSSPVSSVTVVLSYFTGALINTFLIAAGILTIGLALTNISSSLYLSANDIIMAYLCAFLGCASSTLLMMVVVSFFHKASALGAFSGIISAACGFVIGAYIPISSFDTKVQWVLNIFPGSHVAGLFRNFLMNGIVNNMNSAINGVDNGIFIKEIKEAYSFNLSLFGINVGTKEMCLYVLAFIVITLILNVILYRRASKRA